MPLKRLPHLILITLTSLSLNLADAAQAQTAFVSSESGPMLGAVEMREARIWVQTPQSVNISLDYWAAAAPEQVQSLHFQTQASEDFSHVFELVRLQPGTEYHYSLRFNNQRQRYPYPLRFRTQAYWQGRSAPPDFKVALGSCVYLDDPQTPADKRLGGDYQIFEKIYAEQPDLMLWLGDNVYLRPPDFFSATAINDRYRQLRSLPQLQALMGSVAHYAIWDDHDYGANDADRSYRLRTQSLESFRHYWANPSYGLPEAPGVFTRFEWSDVEFFLTDNRYYRAPNGLKDPGKDYFGPAQWQWLKDSLSNSKATFKLLVMGNQILNTQSPSENMYSYTQAYQEFLEWLKSSRIPGVVLLSGDRHHAEFFKQVRAGSYPLYEWTVSPLTSKAYPPFEAEKTVPTRVPGSLLEARNFGILEVKGPEKQRELHLRLLDATGQQRWSYRLTAKELQP